MYLQSDSKDRHVHLRRHPAAVVEGLVVVAAAGQMVAAEVAGLPLAA